ncbi:MAG: aminotransferase [Alphaproteobacteria bacterium]|nr:aminotransferase [Alphaproteobacteria bacterium]
MAAMINSALDRVASPPIAEAESWLQGAAPATNAAPLDLAQAVPNYDPAPELLDYLAGAVREPGTAFYTPILGLDALRESLAASLSGEYGAPISAAETTITTGCNHAFCMATLAVAGAGDEVILPEPFYFNHDMWFDMQGIATVPLPCRPGTEGMVPDPEEAAALITPRTRAIVLITPNNPTGTIYSNARLKAFYDLAANHGLALVIDETYKDFRPADGGDEPQPPHTLFQEEGWRDTLIQLYSFSKAFSLTGYRVGSLVTGERIMAAVAKIADTITICPPHIGQLAALYGLEHLTAWREEKRARVLGLIDALDDAFQRHRPPYDLVSRGAFFAYLRHPFAGTSSIDVAKRLAADQRLLVLPGEFFGESQSEYLRVAFANADTGQLDELASRLARLG